MDLKVTISVFAIVAAAFAYSETNTQDRVIKKNRKPPRTQMEMLNARGYKRTGGGVVKPNTEKGQIIFVNAQSRVPRAAFEKVVFDIYCLAPFPMKVIDAKPGMSGEAAKAAYKSNVAIVIVDDAAQPTSLVALEDGWAMMNIAKLAAGYKGVEVTGAVLESRARKELIRVFSALCGGGGSQFQGNVLDVGKVENLDAAEDFIPMDMKYKYVNYLGSIGVSAPKIVTYEQACREGWAPDPTNDVQKAIREKVFALPTNPIKIKFDPKTDK